MKLGKVNILTFVIVTIICCLLAFTSLVGAGAVDEGTEGKGIFGAVAFILSKLFYVFRFPTHTLLFDHMDGYMFIWGLIINCILYGFIIERLISIFINKKIQDE